MRIDNDTYKFTDTGNFGKFSLIAGIIGIILCVVGYFSNSEQFFFSYLTAYIYWITIVLGALFFVMLQHLVNPVWSVVVRRLVEALMFVIPLMAILFIPILFGMHDLYQWSHPDIVQADKLLSGKAGYLNVMFFAIRAVFYFVVWFALAYSLRKLSVKQDGHFDEARQARMRKISAGGMILFAFTITFAGFDWIMSLDAHWYSTIFGVYVFSGGLMAAIAFITVMFLFMSKRNVLKEQVTVEHYHDLGKLIFAFMVFWAYIAFSQYLLIWYANIPEETIWYQHRWVGSWKPWTLLLVIGHFVAPFFIMITRVAKRNLSMLKFMAFWMLFMHFVDDYFLVMPTLHHDGIALTWIDLGAMLAVGGLLLWFFWRIFTSSASVPISDPKLSASIHFDNF